MSRTARAVFVDGEMIGYLPVTNAENVEYENTNVKAALDGLSSSKIDTAGAGLTKNGTTISTYVPRVVQDANTLPGQYRFNILEYGNASPNLPTSDFYHILTSEGDDNRYAVQFAIGMTTDRMFTRRCDNSSWGSWKELALKSDLPTKKLLDFAQTGSSRTLTFTGSCVTRRIAGTLTICGQNYIGKTVNIAFTGTTGYESIDNRDILISDDLDGNLSISGNTIIIAPNFGGGWGYIIVELYYSELNCSIT